MDELTRKLRGHYIEELEDVEAYLSLADEHHDDMPVRQIARDIAHDEMTHAEHLGYLLRMCGDWTENDALELREKNKLF